MVNYEKNKDVVYFYRNIELMAIDVVLELKKKFSAFFGKSY